MQIGGFIKSSLVDFPGKIAAVIFTQGCNYRCPFCHNAELVIPSQFQEPFPVEEITSFLKKRREVLQGFVLTGGEPTLQPGLEEFLCKVKSLDYPVKMDTNGSRPEVLEELISRGLLDYVAMDIKSSLSRYPEICGVPVDVDAIRKSIDLLLESSIEVEFRTTLVREYVCEDDLQEISTLIKQASKLTLQDFVPRESVLSQHLLDRRVYTEEEVEALRQRWQRPGIQALQEVSPQKS